MTLDYPNQYATNMNYWVKIIAPEKSRIVMQFQKLDIEHQQECLYDFVSVQDANFHFDAHSSYRGKISSKNDVTVDYQDADGTIKHQLDRRRRSSMIEIKSILSNDSAPSFQPYVRWCGMHEGEMSQFDFVSRSNEVLLNFFTDHSTAGEGFSAIWRSIDTSACPSQTITSRDGTLASPNFPHFLIHNLNCSYTIQAPIGRKIWLEFDSYDIMQDANVYVDLGDGALLQPFRTNNIISDGVFTSRGEKVKIILRTGTSPKGKGFRVTYRTSNSIFFTYIFFFHSLNRKNGID